VPRSRVAGFACATRARSARRSEGGKEMRRRHSRPQPRPVGHARGICAKKRSRAGANPGGRSRVGNEPSSDAERSVRVRVLTSDRFYELF
jgi:hypothetical protein